MATLTLRPNADGDYNDDFTGHAYYGPEPVDGGSAWSVLDDVSPPSPNPYSSDYYYEYYADWKGYLVNIENHGSEQGEITNVAVTQVVYIAIDVSDPMDMRISIKTNSTEYYQSFDLTTYGDYTYEYITANWATNPNTGISWTWSEIDNLQIGAKFNMQGGEMYNVLCYATITYTPWSDSGIRYYHNSVVYKVAMQTLVSTNKVRFNKGGTIVGLPLVTTSDANATPIRIYNGSTVQSLAKYT